MINHNSNFLVKRILLGCLTFLPIVNKHIFKPNPGIRINPARYCYSVYLRHLVKAYENGLRNIPEIVCEIGPGYSLGIGLAALISGTQKYIAFDIEMFVKIDLNKKLFDEILALFSSREDIPDDEEFPNVAPRLNSYKFPGYLFNGTLNKSLLINRITSIKKSLNTCEESNNFIEYFVYKDKTPLPLLVNESIDLVISQAVMEHVDNIEEMYEIIYSLLKENGIMSHQIDFGSHGLHAEWNGHYTYSDLMWKIIHGKTPYKINRNTMRDHLKVIEKLNFDILEISKIRAISKLNRIHLAKKFNSISDDELSIRSCFIQAKKINE